MCADCQHSSLYSGIKANGQKVLTWLAMPPVLQFDIDVLSFLRALETNNIITPDLTLGVVEFGTETFYANESITFTASDFSMNLSSNASATSSRPFHSSAVPRPTAAAPPPRPSGARQLASSWPLFIVFFALLWHI
jgi:hypothetical protein